MKRMTPPLCVLLTVSSGVFGQAAPADGVGTEGAAPNEIADVERVPLAEVYESRELLGFGLMVSREFVRERPELLDRVLLQLEADLDEVVHLFPEAALAAVRRTTIWIELKGATNGGMSGRGMCCHWSADWLESVGLPREKAGGVEILNPEDFLAWRRTQPYMVLHELAHAYHRMIGPDLPEIVGAYEAAMEAGLYDEVARNSVEGDKTVRAYAATNHHEYFAEVTEAYFALNDFAPYTRKQLAAVDPAGLAMVERLWTMSADEIAERVAAAGMMGEE
ncbi:MAG: hypothetical protein HND58_15690 [Planctomycetota bacterium]|nr:MAG: hypothetical protein HND58_15690 [Planctomycetota bacterium]